MNANITPIVSVIMPCYNHVTFVAESIESILGQSFSDLELIVVDDFSSDGSRDVIDDFSRQDSRIVPVFHQLNGGEAKSRNEALDKAKGDFIGFCDSDDIWTVNKLSEQLDYLKANPEIGAVHSDSLIIDEVGDATGDNFSTLFKRKQIPEGDIFLDLCLNNFINVPTVLLRRKCVDDAGQFEESFRYLTDWVYWVKVARRNRFGYINHPLAEYRTHSMSTRSNRSGYAECRVMGYKLFKQWYPELPTNVLAEMDYLIGVDYLDLNNRKDAHKYFLKAFRLNGMHLKARFRWLLTSNTRA